MALISVPIVFALVIGLVLGVLIGALTVRLGGFAASSGTLIGAPIGDEPGRRYGNLALVVAIIASPLIVLMTLVAVEADVFSARQAVVVSVLGAAAVLVAAGAVGRLSGGESLQIESHWGGIGGGRQISVARPATLARKAAWPEPFGS